MPVLATSPSSRNDRGYFLVLGLMSGLGGGEGLVVLMRFSAKTRAERAATPPPPTPITSGSGAPTAPSAVSPPVSSAIPPSSATVSASERLLKEARALNERGDTANALARLQEASQRDPTNPQVLAEMATIYESIQLFDRSNETWRKIQELGPSAGTLYELADMKLKTGVPAVTASPPGHSFTDSAGTPLDNEGSTEGSSFGVTDIATEEMPDPEAETNLRLKIAIKARPGVPIDHSKLRIMVLFYDLVDNEKVVPTDADVSYEWMYPKHDLIETNPERLIVTYLSSKTHAVTSEAALSAAAAAVTPGKNSSRSKKRTESAANTESIDPGRRQYLGYVIRILYDDQL